MLKTLSKKLVDLLPSQIAIQTAKHLLNKHDPDFLAVRDLIMPGGHSNEEWQSGLGRQAYLLYGLVRSLKPTTIIEIGSARGLSACTMGLACRHNNLGKVFAVDPHNLNDWTDSPKVNREQLRFFESRIQAYDLSGYCEIIQATSEEAAKNWNRTIDLLFIDGDHSYEGVRKDFELFKPWLTPRSLVLFHDSGWEFNRGSQWYRQDMGVPKYLDQLKLDGFQSVTVLDEAGLTLLDPQRGGLDFLNRSQA
jgi:predicted O-methyltransferase YrrM